MASFPVAANKALKAGDLVGVPTAGAVDALAAGGALLGVAHNDATAGQIVNVQIPIGGIFKVKAATGVNFAIGDRIYAAGGGEFGVGAAGNPVCGFVVDFDPASAGWFRALLVCAWHNPATKA